MDTELATLGGGCFWCLEAYYQKLEGVSKVTSGYAGGPEPDPTYKQICSGTTGHAEVIQIEFNPEQITYSAILEWFWKVHDPTTLNRQGNDSGPQYRSIILTQDHGQVEQAEQSKQSAQSQFSDPIVTEIKPLDTFYPAEDYHQNYFQTNPHQPYCAFVIAPKLQKLGL
ncbi:MAG: peptide-methionine (S)-S-oxide reductase MsrA [Verrucomicrobiota bacterium]